MSPQLAWESLRREPSLYSLPVAAHPARTATSRSSPPITGLCNPTAGPTLPVARLPQKRLPHRGGSSSTSRAKANRSECSACPRQRSCPATHGRRAFRHAGLASLALRSSRRRLWLRRSVSLVLLLLSVVVVSVIIDFVIRRPSRPKVALQDQEVDHLSSEVSVLNPPEAELQRS